MKSLYESLVDWKLKTDYLQCNPNFHGNIPYDCIIISSSEQNFSAHLLMVFTYKCHHATFLFTLVQPFTDVRYQCKKDTDLKLHQLQHTLYSSQSDQSVGGLFLFWHLMQKMNTLWLMFSILTCFYVLEKCIHNIGGFYLLFCGLS